MIIKKLAAAVIAAAVMSMFAGCVDGGNVGGGTTGDNINHPTAAVTEKSIWKIRGAFPESGGVPRVFCLLSGGMRLCCQTRKATLCECNFMLDSNGFLNIIIYNSQMREAEAHDI